MDRLEYHKQRLDQALGFKRDENYEYEIGIENDAFVPESTGIVPEKEEKGTEFPLNFQTGANFEIDNPFKESNAYKKYMSTRDDVLEEAKGISAETGIPYDAIIMNGETMSKAREIYDYKKKVMDFAEVYKRYPGLKKLNENDGAISLHNIEDVKKVHGVFEAAKVGVNTDSLDAERNALGFEKLIGNKVDEKRLQEVTAEIEELKELPDLLEAPAESIVGGLAQQGKMLARHFIKGLDTVALFATVGAVSNAALNRENIALRPAMIIGARTAIPAGIKTGMGLEMFKESAGGSYLTYTGYKDKFGNQLLTDSEARVFAVMTAAAETTIEMANFDAVINVLKGSKNTLSAGKLLESIVKNAGDRASFQAQVKTWLKENLRNAGVIAGTEIAEEGVQEISSMGITKIAQTLNPEGNIPDYSASDILKGGFEAARQAAGASVGFALAGAGASGYRFSRQAAQLMELGKERADEALRTNTGANLVSQLMEAARTTKLGTEHKGTYNNLMKSNLEGTAHETSYVDTEVLLEQEGGERVFNQLAAAAGLTEEQISTYKDTGAPIQMNTADLVSAMAEETEINIQDYISFDAADRCLARNQKVAEELKKLANRITTKEVERTIENINTLATEMFGETEERDYAVQIISEYEDPSAGAAERRREINQEINGMLDPVINKMRGGMKQGVSLHFTDDYGNVIDEGDHDSHIGGAVRFSNNDLWYSKYFAQNKKAPTEGELRELAEEIITGKNEYGVEGYDYTDPGMQEFAEENKARLESLRYELDLLDKVEAKLKDVDRGEFAALDALTPEGVMVYKQVADMLRTSPNPKDRKSATMGALIFAHMGDTYAKGRRLIGDKKYTALDWWKRVQIRYGGEVGQGYNQSDVYGVTEEVFNKQKEEVLEGINPFTAIVVFGGDIVSGYSVGPKGQSVIKSNGERVIRLFETSDESTFIHEAAHIAYEDLRELAAMENAPAQFKRDLKTLDDWADWKEGQIDEYVGSAVYKEFAARDAAIKEALAAGDTVTAESLKYEWKQERFARGFEEYLKKGKAPTEGLRKVFYQFKKWLTAIYRAYKNIGGAPTKEVEDVMKRMLLTEEAIELAEKKAELEAFEKSGVFNYLESDTSQAMWQKILEEIRADATRKVLKIAMKDMSDAAKEDRQAKLAAEREAARERIANEPVWIIQSFMKYNPKVDMRTVCETYGMTLEEYVAELKAKGGSLDNAIDAYMATYEKELEDPSKAEIQKRAEEALTSSYYKQLLSAFEVELLQSKVRQEARLSRKISSIVASGEEDRAEQEKALREMDKKAEEARSQRALRDIAVGNVEKVREYARQKLATMNVAYAANPNVWKNASRQKATEMTAALAKKEYGKAAQAAKMRLVYDCMADIATGNKVLVDRKTKQMKDRAKTIRREKNMAANDRYVYNHLLYAFGLAEKDVPKPPSYENFQKVLLSYDSSLSIPFIDNDGSLTISDFIMSAGTDEGRFVRLVHDLTISEFKELADVMDNIYTVAVNSHKIKTVRDEAGKEITIDQVVAEIYAEAEQRRQAPEVKDTTGAGNIERIDKILNVANRVHISLLKMETLLSELSPKAYKYIYEPIKRAADRELAMTVEFGDKIQGIRDAWINGKIAAYLGKGMSEGEARSAAEKELKDFYTVKKYRLGTSMLTKENIIAFALNWGTELNRARALNYEGTTKAAFERLFTELDSADWQFVTDVWALFDETWPQIKEVEARVSGVTLEKQEGITFNITDKEGVTYAIKGGYYPIRYDKFKNHIVGRLEKEEGVRSQMPSMVRMGVGIGMTKERAQTTSYKIRNDLGVIGEAMNENIHLICMREAVRDASRIINDPNFVQVVETYLGGNAVNALKDWVLDSWQLEPKVKNDLEGVMQYLRKKQTMAVLGFRLSTALLNAANIGPVMSYLGGGRTLKALTDFYRHPKEQYDFVIEKSTFVKNRAQTMDRDVRDVLKEKDLGDKMDKIQAMGFYLITKTDLALACPLWLSEYQRVYKESLDLGLKADEVERRAVDAGDKAVRNVFGSGMVQDLAAVQKGSEATKLLTTYYSYFSVVYQAISRAVYERNRRKINKASWFERNAPILEMVVFWLIIPAAISVLMRSIGDDDELTIEEFLKKTGAETINTAAGGVPIVRDFTSLAMTYALDGKYYGARSTPIGETMDSMMDIIRSLKGFAEDKKDIDDVIRAVLKGSAYVTGLPVTITEGVATLMQWFMYGDATEEEIIEYLKAIAFGKKVQK